MNVAHGLLLPLLLVAVGSREPVRIAEITSKEIVDLLTGITNIRDCKRGDKFCLRLFLYRTEGECPEGAVCGKDQLLVLAATFDEYPEKRAFRLQLPGGFKRVSVLAAPKTEGGAFTVAVYTESAEGAVSCATYSVSLAEMLPLKSPCPAESR
jgi:hypothetical protein